MKPYWFYFLFVTLLAACVSPAIPNTSVTLIPTSTEIPASETPAPTATSEPTATTPPTETLASTQTAIPTLDPNLGIISWSEFSFLGKPTDSPLTEFCGAPILNTAIAGAENGVSYIYNTYSQPMEVYQYYRMEMPKLNWELARISDDLFGNIPLNNANLDEFHSSMMFLNPSGQGISISIMGDFNNNLIYVWLDCAN